MSCTCGCVDDHQIARRRTFDDKIIVLWSDGALTWALALDLASRPVP